MLIKEVKPGLIKNSRGEKTVEIILKTLKGKFSASAPSGKSKGKHETPDYNERGIEWSFRMLKVLCERLNGKNFHVKTFLDLKKFEKFISSFEASFGKLGANCTYALETAFLKAAAAENGKELWQFIREEKAKPKIPMPAGNCIGGGMHSLGKKPDFQEFLLIPYEKTFSRAFTKNIHAYDSAKKILAKRERKWFLKKNDENALQSTLANEEILDILREVARKYNLRAGIDAAASTFFDANYKYKNKKIERNRKEQIEYIKMLAERYNLSYIEDPLDEEDFHGFAALKSELEKENIKTMIVADDLTTTNISRLGRAAANKAIDAVIIKPNQNGHILEVARVVKFCKAHNIKMVFSHRSGETMDDALSDYAVGFQADFIKTGIIGKERLIKLRRVMEIEKGLRKMNC